MNPTSGEATTGSLVAQPKNPYRLARASDLNPREQLLVHYMVNGCDTPSRLNRIRRLNEHGELVPVLPGVPLTLREAAQLTRIRTRHARTVVASPAGLSLTNRLTAELRNGAKPRAMQRIVDQLDRPQHKAADARVVQEAAALILGDTVGQPRNNTVNVSVGVAVTPGYVIDLTDRPSNPPTIEHAENDT